MSKAPVDRDKISRQLALIRVIEKSASNGVYLHCGNGDVALELNPQEVEVHVQAILQDRKSKLGMQLASAPKEITPLIVGSAGSADQQRTSKEAVWRY